MTQTNSCTTAFHVCAFAYMFTGKERDAESGLDYFGARYYASNMGRFMSPDFFANDTHPEDPQSWNLYGYVRNNPLRLVDPDGEKVYVGSVTGRDRDQLLGYMNFTYGCDGCVTVGNDGYLNVDTSGLSDSVLAATANLTGAINTTDWFAEVRVSNNDDSVAFGETRRNRGAVTWDGTRRNADLIVLDFADNKQIAGDSLAAQTWVSTVLPHEILHEYPNRIGDPTGAAALTQTGPVVDAVNGITDARGLPRRSHYASVPGILPGTQRQDFTSKGKNNKEQQRIIWWQKNNVGGK